MPSQKKKEENQVRALLLVMTLGLEILRLFQSCAATAKRIERDFTKESISLPKGS